MNENDYMLIVGILLSLGLLYRWQRKDDQFDLRYLLVDTVTEKVSLFKLGQLVALLVSTWALIHETRANHLTEWLFGSYMIAWAGVNLGNKIVEKMKDKEQK